MRKPASTTLAMASALTLMFGGLTAITHTASAAEAATVIEQGKAIAFNRKLGNCLACHKIKGGEMPGNIGPALVNMAERYPDKKELRMVIWNMSKFNPNTIMPPFGKNKILTNDELDKVVEFIHTL